MQTRSLKLLIVVLSVISIISISYAVTQMTIQNTSTIVAGQNIFITQPSTTNPGSCPADANSGYTQSPTSIAWTLTTGAVGQNYFFCIDNQGSAPDALSITSSLTPGSCPATGNNLVYGGATGVPASLAGHTATTAPVDITVCAGSSMTAGAGPTFTVTVT